MKRKSIVLFICCLMLASFLVACGESEPTQETEQNPGQNTVVMNQDKRQDTNAPGKVVISEAVATATPTPTAEPVMEPALFDKMPEWDAFYAEYGKYYNAVQIEDMFFYAGMFGADVVEAVANSEDTEVIRVAGDKLVEDDLSVKETQKITYYRGEEAWFDVYVINNTESLLPFSECLVSLVLPREAAMEYCRFFDGTYTLEVLRSIKYSEYGAFEEKIKGMGYDTWQDGKTWKVRCIGQSLASVIRNNEKRSKYWVSQLMVMNLTVNLDMGVVDDIEVEAGSEGSYGVYGMCIPEDFDWSNEEFKDSVIAYLSSEDAKYDYWRAPRKIRELDNPELVSVYQGVDAGNYLFMVRGYHAKEERTIYIICDVNNVGIDINNQMTKLSDENRFYTVNSWGREAVDNRYPAGIYIEALAQDILKDKALICTYCDNLITEYKQVDSFEDISAEQLNTIIEYAISEAEDKCYSWGSKVAEIRAAKPCYISFGNAEAEGEHLAENAVWMIIELDLYKNDSDKEWAEFVYVDFYGVYVDLERNRAYCSSTNTMDRYDNFDELLVDTQLTGTPEENIWVTELLPYELAQELKDLYGYEIYDISIEH